MDDQGQQQDTASRQYSPDGRYFWDGRRWVSVQQQVDRFGRVVLVVSLLVALSFILLGFIFWLTWQQFESGTKAEVWSYSKLIKNAQAGQVKSITIDGSSAVATGKDGSLHDVNLPAETALVAAELTQDDVDVQYEAANSGQAWLQILVPDLILLLLLCGFMYYILRGRRRRLE